MTELAKPLGRGPAWSHPSVVARHAWAAATPTQLIATITRTSPARCSGGVPDDHEAGNPISTTTASPGEDAEHGFGRRPGQS